MDLLGIYFLLDSAGHITNFVSISGEFSYAKLEEKRGCKPGCYIVRESELQYEAYFLDVCVQGR